MRRIAFGIFLACTLAYPSAPILGVDCNANDVEDSEDLTSQLSSDCNENGIPDECEFAPVQLGLGPQRYLLDGEASFLFRGDCNLDPRPDLIAVQTRDGETSLEVFHGQESRTFERLPASHLGTRAVSALVAADFDGDEDTDLVGYGGSEIFVLEYGGAGQFTETRTTAAQSITNNLAVGDVNGDGRPDVVTTNRLRHTIGVLTQSPDGSLLDNGTFPLSGDFPVALALGDLDGDQALDVVTLDRRTESVSILINSGDGTFGAPRGFEIGGNTASSIDLFDFDNDGDLDFLIAFDEKVAIHFNPGDATPGPARIIDVLPVRTSVADVDSDGNLDLIVADAERSIEIFLNLGSGPFVPLADIPAEAQFVAPGDFDGDGTIDVALIADDPSRMDLLVGGLIDRVQFESVRTPLSTRSRPHQIGLGDFNGDGLPDVVAANSNLSDFYTVAYNQGGGRFDRVRHHLLPNDGVGRSADTGDLDSDGDIDILLGDLQSGLKTNVLVIRNLGNEEFAEPVPFFIHPHLPHNVDLGDIDGDGDLDALAVAATATVLTLLNDGTGTLGDLTEIALGVGPYWGETGDFDQDGDIDYAVSDRPGLALFVLENRGDGVFDDHERYPLPAMPRIVNPSDIDGDADLDLLVVNGSAVSVLRNAGDGTFALPESYDLQRDPYSVIALDFDGDGFLDLGTANERSGSVSILTGRGDGTFDPPFHLPAGAGVRHAIASDLDLDGDVDVIVGNRPTNALTALLNPATESARGGPDFRTRICTPLDFHELAAPSRSTSIRSALKFLAPATDDPEQLETVYQNTNRFRLHQEFLAAVFPERFPSLSAQEYGDLVNRRASRQYYAGVIQLVQTQEGLVYGFSVLVDSSDVGELLSQAEVEGVYAQLQQSLSLELLAYFPQTQLERELASSWTDTNLPILTDSGPTGTYQAYTRGVAFGRVRILDREAFDVANERGQFGFQDILVLDHAPRDVETVVAALLTAEPQTENSHTFIRMAIRNTPNAFVDDAQEALAPSEGQLIRLEVRETGFTVRAAELEEAQAFWDASRPSLQRPPSLDPDYSELPSLSEIATMELQGETTLVARFGGKASNLARLRTVLDTPEHRQYQESGFAIPMHYYLEFLRSNELPSALAPERLVTYENYLHELFESAEFQTNSAFRFEALDDLRDHMRDEGVVDPELVARVAARIGEVLGTPSTTRVRFRSSSNMEDDIQFNGAGLYDSTSGCPEDDLDADDLGPSHCDGTRNEERSIVRALKRVWRSLWNFKAYEERAFFGIDQKVAAMAVLVNRTFVDESANGVAFTGNLTNPQDRRFVITAQLGEESVVSPEPGVRAEKDLLAVSAGEVVEIVRASLSTLIEPGGVVLTETQLRELGALMWHIDQNFPVALGGFSRDQVLLDMEFKFLPDGELAIKQVRPFLLQTEPLPTPDFELDIPFDTQVCGTYVPFRGAAEAYAAKSTVRFKAGLVALPTTATRVTEDLIEEVRYGPDQALATAVEEGVFRLERIPAADDVTSYVFVYSQLFVLADGASLEINGRLLFRARGEDVLADGRLVLDEPYFTAEPGNEGFTAILDGAPTVRYGSCDLAALPRIEVIADFADGSRLELIERIGDEEDREFFAAPARLGRARWISSDGNTLQSESYWQLVYAAANHNDPVDYWLVLDTPQQIPGAADIVFAIEFKAPPVFRVTPGGRDGELRYLGVDLSVLGTSALVDLKRRESTEVIFRRGDVQADGRINIADALYLLDALFRRGPAPPCARAADVNNDGRLEVADALAVLLHLFRGTPLPSPSPSCDAGSENTLTCESFPGCK